MDPSWKTVTKGSKGNVSLKDAYASSWKQRFVACITLHINHVRVSQCKICHAVTMTMVINSEHYEDNLRMSCHLLERFSVGMVNIHVLGKSTKILLDATVTNVLSGVNGLVCSFMTHNTKNLDTSHTTSTAWTQGVIIRQFTYHPNQFGS